MSIPVGNSSMPGSPGTAATVSSNPCSATGPGNRSSRGPTSRRRPTSLVRCRSRRLIAPRLLTPSSRVRRSRRLISPRPPTPSSPARRGRAPTKGRPSPINKCLRNRDLFNKRLFSKCPCNECLRNRCAHLSPRLSTISRHRLQPAAQPVPVSGRHAAPRAAARSSIYRGGARTGDPRLVPIRAGELSGGAGAAAGRISARQSISAAGAATAGGLRLRNATAARLRLSTAAAKLRLSRAAATAIRLCGAGLCASRVR